jgi:hypothetical protein
MICLDSVVSGLLCIYKFFCLSLHFLLLTVTGLRICASSELHYLVRICAPKVVCALEDVLARENVCSTFYRLLATAFLI